MTLSFALGFGATRRDFWLGTSLMFGFVSVLNAVAIATLVQLEKATNGWWLNIAMFDALWYGQNGWLVDFYTTLALQLFVLFIGASVTTVYLRWRMRGMLILAFGAIALALGGVAIATFTESWPAIFEWFGGIGIVGVFTVVLGLAVAVRGRRLPRDPAGHAALIGSAVAAARHPFGGADAAPHPCHPRG